MDDKKNALEHLPRMRHTKEREKEEEERGEAKNIKKIVNKEIKA